MLKILNEHPKDTRVRSDEILAVVGEFFDLEGIARGVLGPQWNNQSREKQQEFTQDFSKLLTSTIGDIGNYAKGEITYSQKQTGENHAVVKTLVSGTWAGKIGIDYYLRQKNGTWKVHDVAVRGISLVTNYRSQFTSILSKNSFDYLLKQLEKKIPRS